MTRFSSHRLLGGQQNDSSRGIIPSEKPLQQPEPLNAHHKMKKVRLDDALSGALIIPLPTGTHTHPHTAEGDVSGSFEGEVSECCAA